MITVMKLRDAINQNGLTVKEVYETAKVSRQTVENALNGSKAIRYAYAQKIVNAINSLTQNSYTVNELEIYTK